MHPWPTSDGACMVAGETSGISARTRTRFVLAVLAICAASLGSLALYRQRAATTSGVQETLLTLVELEGMLSSLQDAETGQRGFLLTRRESYLEPYRRGAAEVPGRLESLRRALARDSVQTERLARLQALTGQKLRELEETIQLAGSGRQSDALALIDSGRGKALMDDVRRVVAEIVDAERHALEARQAKERAAGDVFLAGSFAGGAVLLLLTVLTFLGARRDLQDAQRVSEERGRTQDYQHRAISILGHDIRTPLAAAELASDQVLNGLAGQPGSPVRRNAEIVRRSARRALRIVDSLLDLTHLRLGNGLPLSPSSSNLFEVARVVADEIHADERSRVSLEILGSGEGVFDEVRLGQAVSNLVVNALKYGRAGTPIRITIDGRDPVRLRVTVHNEGDPIRPELIPHLFDPFRRGDAVGRRDSLGLGLYIVQEIARAHGGQVEVVSSEPGGTRFTLDIPRNVSAPTASPPRAAAAPAPVVSEVTGVGEPIRRLRETELLWQG